MFDRKTYMKKYNKQYRIDNSERIKEYNREYRIENKERIAKHKNEYMKQYRIDNIEKILENAKKRWKAHPIHSNKTREYMRQYCKINSTRIYERGKQWRKDNSERSKEQVNAWQKNKWKTDPRYKLNIIMANTINASLKGNKKGRHWEDLVGYSCKDLIKRLRNTMPEGYTWDDFLQGKLHIDHIIPKSAFNYIKSEHADFKRCWALDNLQLLLAGENQKKSDKLYKPFQPCLKISIAEGV